MSYRFIKYKQSFSPDDYGIMDVLEERGDALIASVYTSKGLTFLIAGGYTSHCPFSEPGSPYLEEGEFERWQDFETYETDFAMEDPSDGAFVLEVTEYENFSDAARAWI